MGRTLLGVTEKTIDRPIRTKPCPDCYVCNTRGEPLYYDLKDLLFGVPGIWHLKKCPNPTCGLIWLDPMPVLQDLARLYASYYTHDRPVRKTGIIHRVHERTLCGYLNRQWGYTLATSSRVDVVLGYLVYLHPAYRAYADARVMNLRRQSTAHLLEIGFGNANILDRLQSYGWLVEGVEADPVAVENARKKGLNVRLGDLIDQHYPDESFDAIVSSHVIEHVPDPLELLIECHRILRPEGRLVFYTPNANSWGHSLYKEHWRGLEPPRHLYLFTTSSLTALACKAGFKNPSSLVTDRGAGYLRESHMLKKGGRRDLSGDSFMTKSIHMLSPFFSWFVCLFRPGFGSEIILSATK
jgi:SAM-dependent methyltransferase